MTSAAIAYNKCLTGVKLQYAAGTLSKAQYKAIPRSTRQAWRKLAPSQFWTPADVSGCFDHDHPQLLQALTEVQRLRRLLRSMAYLLLLQRAMLKLFVLKQPQYLVPIRKISQIVSRRCERKPGAVALHSFLLSFPSE